MAHVEEIRGSRVGSVQGLCTGLSTPPWTGPHTSHCGPLPFSAACVACGPRKSRTGLRGLCELDPSQGPVATTTSETTPSLGGARIRAVQSRIRARVGQVGPDEARRPPSEAPQRSPYTGQPPKSSTAPVGASPVPRRLCPETALFGPRAVPLVQEQGPLETAF